jgi:SNF2 family DNA or RNA helicase
VDCRSPDFEVLNEILDKVVEKEPVTRTSQIKLSRLELFRLQSTSKVSAEVKGEVERAALLKRMLALKPARPLPVLKGLASSLRPYQKRGVEWLRFLFENVLGGLLCDDMGLGKTHQVMALMLALREKERVTGPFLVACPTTVLSHWRNKILEHAPGLKAELFHGGQRDLDEILTNGDVVITSYGILRNDIDQLENTPFALAVFDEIQYIKNPHTKAYAAAQNLKAEVKLGLTGTPIENSLVELKALFDLTVPGYLGSDKEFQTRYIKSIELEPDGTSRGELSRLVSPFTLRRLKKTVLEQLPEKIEDIRTCTLSDDQTKLYRDAISSRGKGLMEVLKSGEKPVPYMHVFALLTLLKQICNHPAMVDGRLDDYERYQSGKWDLFKELLSESLDSGQKVVVYSQFVGMIRIIEKILHDWGVGFVTLTGASRKRGEIISRFNEDPNIRTYVGSLRAGGTGVDLIAASVVIHYDRWWNAAKEDQATDRVHRIGQKRGVQVFKLVTEGTLEEKISAIIEKKRELMESVVREDDPGLLKIFSREELINILSAPR